MCPLLPDPDDLTKVLQGLKRGEVVAYAVKQLFVGSRNMSRVQVSSSTSNGGTVLKSFKPFAVVCTRVLRCYRITHSWLIYAQDI